MCLGVTWSREWHLVAVTEHTGRELLSSGENASTLHEKPGGVGVCSCHFSGSLGWGLLAGEPKRGVGDSPGKKEPGSGPWECHPGAQGCLPPS